MEDPNLMQTKKCKTSHTECHDNAKLLFAIFRDFTRFAREKMCEGNIGICGDLVIGPSPRQRLIDPAMRAP